MTSRKVQYKDTLDTALYLRDIIVVTRSRVLDGRTQIAPFSATQNYRNMKMHKQNNALPDTLQYVLSLVLTFDLLFRFIKQIYQSLSNCILLFKKKMLKLSNVMKTKNPLTVSYHFFNTGNSNGICSGTFLTQTTCVTVPVIGGGDYI